VGGDDQWGNIVAGVDLIRRMRGERAWGLTTPLLTTATGAKMGKTAAGAVWLDGERLSPFDYWQYWYNVDDRDVGRFLKLYTFLPLDEITKLEALAGAEAREAKRVLANETTRLLHGADAAEQADAAARAMAAGVATDDLPTHGVSEDSPLLVVLAEAGLAKSRGEARRLIQQGGVKLDGERVTDLDTTIVRSELGAEGVVVRVGKKRAARIVAG
jgi:tyrosyl-tRNA synthetase